MNDIKRIKSKYEVMRNKIKILKSKEISKKFSRSTVEKREKFEEVKIKVQK